MARLGNKHGGRTNVAVAVLLCFCGLLRVGEALSLHARDVVLTDNFFVLFLAVTKRGTAERVVIHNAGVLDFLKQFLARFPRRPDELLIGASYFIFTKWFRKALEALGVAEPYRSHSLRRGGATALFMEGVSLPNIMVYGRWRSEGSCRLYIRSAEVLVLSSTRSWTPQIAGRIRLLAALGPRVFREVSKA